MASPGANSGCLLVAGRLDHAVKEELNRVAAAFGRNRDTRVQDQSHAGGVSGSL
jgi:hypothetical protein